MPELPMAIPFRPLTPGKTAAAIIEEDRGTLLAPGGAFYPLGCECRSLPSPSGRQGSM